MEQRKRFDVTDPDLDAPDGAVVDGYERRGGTWEPIAPPCACCVAVREILEDTTKPHWERINKALARLPPMTR